MEEAEVEEEEKIVRKLGSYTRPQLSLKSCLKGHSIWGVPLCLHPKLPQQY